VPSLPELVEVVECSHSSHVSRAASSESSSVPTGRRNDGRYAVYESSTTGTAEGLGREVKREYSH
jgi:hypothetical protein